MNAKIGLVIQLGIGLVLLLSAVGKGRDPTRFAERVVDYQILPAQLAYAFGLALISLEAWLGVAHLTGWLLRFAVPIALATFAVFVVAVLVNLGRGRALPCYCFGYNDADTGPRGALVRLLLLIVGESLMLHSPDRYRLTYWQVRGVVDLGLAVLWAIFLLLLALWIFRFPDLWSVLRPCPRCRDGKRRTTRAFDGDSLRSLR